MAAMPKTVEEEIVFEEAYEAEFSKKIDHI
jgi:hypothetical protein